MGRVDDKVVLVTGAAGGQGAAEALALTAEGATVVATDLREPELDGVEGRVLDVTDAGHWAAVVADVVASHGRIDALVNNAGVPARERLLDLEPELLRRTIDVNLTGSLLGIQAVAPHIPAGGSIVNIASVAGVLGYHAAAYTISKWGVRALSKVASVELGPRGIRVNTILPGFIDTPMTQAAPPAFRTVNVELSTLGRSGVPEDVAPLVVYLVSDESSFVSGAEIVVDGGQTGHGGAKAISDALREGPP